MPLWPVNQRMALPSKVAVFRFAARRLAGSGKRWISLVTGSTRTIAFRPPSVIQGAPSGPAMTPCGAERWPSALSGIQRDSPVIGSSQPSAPPACAVYQTPPSAAGATSCGPAPSGSGNSWVSRLAGAKADAAAAGETRPSSAVLAISAERISSGNTGASMAERLVMAHLQRRCYADRRSVWTTTRGAPVFGRGTPDDGRFVSRLTSRSADSVDGYARWHAGCRRYVVLHGVHHPTGYRVWADSSSRWRS